MTDAMYHKSTNSAGATSKTVMLSGRDVQDAVRLLSLLTPEISDDDLLEWKARGDQSRTVSRSDLVQMAKRMLVNRRRRAQRFGREMFGEPAWDILLVLYATEGTTRLTISRLTRLAGAPDSTALRWLIHLEEQRLVMRAIHPTDRRTAFIELTEKGRSELDAYFSETLATAS